ncbi:MAG: filamentous hemagglutinin N-terminal domain-containing protein [Gammaproteobacteria bacterium]
MAETPRRRFAPARLAGAIRRALDPRALGWSALAWLPGLAIAGPAGEQVIAGAATVSRPDAGTTLIDQASPQAILQWQQFSVGSQEYVQFRQPGSQAIALNRVVGGQPSEILGRLQANGRVFLVNTNGVLFGHGAQVDVGALVASTLDIRDDDFLAGRYLLVRPDGAAPTAVVNEGALRSAEGGFVVLAGAQAVNAGRIETPAGSAVLAAGDRIGMDIGGDGLVTVSVDAAAAAQAAGVANTGEILAEGGRIVLAARVAEDLAATAVNAGGTVRARNVVERAGEVWLVGAGGEVAVDGTVDASGADGAAGGSVRILGDGDVVLAQGAHVAADGGDGGDGGTVDIIADGRLQVRAGAEISARAGAGGQSGGAVELSGHEALSVRGAVRIGPGGRLLIDPAVLRLGAGTSSGESTVAEAFIEAQLRAGTDVTLEAESEIQLAGAGFTIDAHAGSAGPGNGALTLRISASSTDGGGSGIGDLNLADLNIDIDGDVDLAAGSQGGMVRIGAVRARDIQITAEGGIATGALTLHGSGSREIDISNGSSGAVEVGAITVESGVGSASVAIDNNGGGGITVHGDVVLDVGNSAFVRLSNDSGSGGLRVDGRIEIAAGSTAEVNLDNSGAGGIVLSDPDGPDAIRISTGEGAGSLHIEDTGAGAIDIGGNVIIDAEEGAAQMSIRDFGGGGIHIGSPEAAVRVDALSGSTSEGSARDSNITIENFNGAEVVVYADVLAEARGRGSARVSFGSSDSGAVNVNGDITALANGDFERARVALVNDGPGNIVLRGNALAQADGSIASASVEVRARLGVDIDIEGDLTAVADGAEGFATVEIDARDGGDVSVTGDLVATATGDEGRAGVSISAEDGGNVTLSGNTRVEAGSTGFVSIFAERGESGPETGRVDVGGIALDAGGSGGVFIAGTGITVRGAVVSRAEGFFGSPQPLALASDGPLAGLGIIVASASDHVRTAGDGVLDGQVLVQLTGGDPADVAIAVRTPLVRIGLSTIGSSTCCSEVATIQAVAPITVASAAKIVDVDIRNTYEDPATIDLIDPALAYRKVSLDYAGDLIATGSGDTLEASESLQVRTGGNLQLISALGVVTPVLDIDAAGGILLPGMDAAVGTFELVAGTQIDLSASMIQASGAGTLQAGTDILIGSTMVHAAALSLQAGGAVEVVASDVVLDGPGTFVAGTDVVLQEAVVQAAGLALTAGANVFLSGSALSSTGLLDISAGGGVFNGPATLAGAAVRIVTGTDISLGASTLVAGSGTVAGAGDPAMLDFMRGFGIVLPEGTDPNLFLSAGGNIALHRLVLEDGYPYVRFKLNGRLTLDEVQFSGTEILAQLEALDPTRTIGVENVSGIHGGVNFGNLDHFARFSGTTIAIGNVGSRQIGGIIIGRDSSIIDLGDKNFLCLSLGECVGIERIRTTGIVASLVSVLETFQAPQVDEFGEPREGALQFDSDRDDELAGLIEVKDAAADAMCR